MKRATRSRVISAFPWEALDRLDPSVENALRLARRWIERGVAPNRWAAALGELIGGEISLHVRSIDAREAPGPLHRVGFCLASGRGQCVVGLEPALSAVLLAKLLRRPVPHVPAAAELDPALVGALSALFVEAARRSGVAEALCPREATIAQGSAIVHGTVIVDGRPYVAVLWVAPEWTPLPEANDGLERLGDVELALPLVVANNLATPADLARLGVGAAWCPGPGWMIDASLRGEGILVAGTSERGLRVELREGSEIVLREPAAAVLAPPDVMSAPSDDPPEPATLPQAVLDAPLVVRVELGMVSLKAREWAALKPGDVLETGRRIAEPVVLRAGGRQIARGELVNIEGELGVRITEVFPEGGT